MTTTNDHRILIQNAHLYGPDRDWSPGWLLVERGGIRLMGAGRPPEFPDSPGLHVLDAGGKALLPGFIDLHVHGAIGHEVMDASEDGLRAIARFYASHGVTAFLPTTWTGARETTLQALQTVAALMGPVENGATILGAHMEGPYLNPERCGAQDAKLIRKAEREEALEFLDLGVTRLITLAPEFEENLWLVDECVRRGITVSMGHTAATYEQVRAAVERGVKHATHTFNAMTPLDHRALGTVGAVMAFPQIRCELIADNIHVHPEVQKILVSVKGPAGMLLVTDAIRGAGLPEGEYRIDERTVTVRDGAVRLPNGSLAGSILTLDRALKNIIASTGLTLTQAWPMVSLNAAREIGVSSRKGSLEVGKDADLVMLDADFNVALTMVEGRIVYQAG
jgi:N-acetylglucosamine-6-phosphate deacetylase